MSNLGDILRQVVSIPNHIPDDWSFFKLTDICSPKQWRTISSSEMAKTGYPVFGANGFVGFYHEYNHEDEAIAITCRGNTCGTINKIPPKTYITGNSMALDDIKPTVISQDYLYYALKYRGVGDSISGSAQPQITGAGLRSIEFPAPPLPEQQKIATILSSVDKVIETTRAQINKLKDLKTGMMQELLTKGIGVDGVPHTEFKDSPVGRIPVGWGVVTLGEVGKWKGGGTPSKSNKEYWKGSIPWVSPKDMKSEYITQTEDQISEAAVNESSTNLVNAGSLLIVVRSGILKHTLPIAIATCNMALNQDMKSLTVKKGFCPVFIYHYLLAYNHHVLRATLKAGNTVESIDFNELSKFLIPYPSLAEQKKIASAVESIAMSLRSKQLQLNSYTNVKKALMQDLLTGKVRVAIDKNKKEPEAA